MRGDTEAVLQPAAAGTAVERALEALRLDWGNQYLIGYDEDHGWWASRHGRVGGLLEGTGPDELRAAIAADYGPARGSRRGNAL
jgi:hypothetical protein